MTMLEPRVLRTGIADVVDESTRLHYRSVTSRTRILRDAVGDLPPASLCTEPREESHRDISTAEVDIFGG